MTNRAVTLVFGIASVILGIVLWTHPNTVMTLLAVLAGALLLAGGISAVNSWNKNMRGTASGIVALTAGILAIVGGASCIISPLATASSFTWLVALTVAIIGVAQLVMMLATPVPGKTVGTVCAVLVIVLGVYAMGHPALLVKLLGAAFIIEGASLVVLGVAKAE